jgi:hypothetical protein
MGGCDARSAGQAVSSVARQKRRVACALAHRVVVRTTFACQCVGDACPLSEHNTGYAWSCLACMTGHSVPVWQPCIGSSIHLRCAACHVSTSACHCDACPPSEQAALEAVTAAHQLVSALHTLALCARPLLLAGFPAAAENGAPLARDQVPGLCLASRSGRAKCKWDWLAATGPSAAHVQGLCLASRSGCWDAGERAPACDHVGKSV